MTPRALLFVPLLVSMGCVTLDGQRHALAENLVSTRCEPGRPSAMVDASVRDRVRLVFSKSDHCTETWATRYEKEQRWRLSDGVRTAFAVGAGLIVAVPLYALVLTAGARSPVRRVDVGLEQPTPTYSGIPGALSEPIAYGIIFGGLGMGAAANEAMKASDPLQSIEVTEHLERQRMGEVVVKVGRVNAPGLAVGGLPLWQGALELSLDEAQGLADGELYLDGERVELEGDARERLSFLPICKRALDAYEAGVLLWDQTRRSLIFQQAEACDRRGWTFAEDARKNAVAARP